MNALLFALKIIFVCVNFLKQIYRTVKLHFFFLKNLSQKDRTTGDKLELTETELKDVEDSITKAQMKCEEAKRKVQMVELKKKAVMKRLETACLREKALQEQLEKLTEKFHKLTSGSRRTSTYEQ